MSASSSSSSSQYPSFNRPQQDGFSSHVGGILRQTPPSGQHYHQQQQQSHTLHRNSYTTPLHRPRQQQHVRQPTPLILDPSAPHSLAPSEGSEQRLMGTGTVRKLLDAATRRRDVVTPSVNSSDDAQFDNGGGSAATPSHDNAASFARTAPTAGFLSKFGTNVPEFKRRFFVLKPSTHLYYFLSPADTEPRGCIDLEGAAVEEMEHLPDGRFRFALLFHHHQPHHHPRHQRRIVLEARSEEVGRQWMQSIQVERLSYAKQQVEEQKRINLDHTARIAELERELDDYKLVERDRDGALEDAANWKRQFDRLNEGLRLLTQHLRRAPATESGGKDDKDQRAANGENTIDDNSASHPDHDGSQKGPVLEGFPENITSPAANVSHRETSLLDAVEEDERQIDELDFPGTHFSALSNTCQQLRESLRLASIEASAAVDDLNATNQKMMATEKRMAKAEKHICKLWEENCAIRKTLKQNKKEKRVLVREVKYLIGSERQGPQGSLSQDKLSYSTHSNVTTTDDSSAAIASEEERLIDELESHVMSSIRLHEQFLGVNSGLGEQLMDSVKKIASGEYDDNDGDSTRRKEVSLQANGPGATLRIENKGIMQVNNDANDTSFAASTDTGASGHMSPLRPTILSLFDDESDDDEEEDNEEESQAPSIVSSVGAELGEPDLDGTDHESDNQEYHGIKQQTAETKPTVPANIGDCQPQANIGVYPSEITQLLENDEEEDDDDDDDEPESDRSEYMASNANTMDDRKHPLLKLDQDDDEGATPNLCASSTQSESSKSVITDNGHATSRLVCPLADVVGTREPKNGRPGPGEDGRVYHLTFYSRKIGLQFQKVPASNATRGLLTDAMTADLPVDRNGHSRGTTAAELRRIAAISKMANSDRNPKTDDDVLQVATPVDAVLVCGFHGFDDSANHTRPKLGARLVAFDGIPVEIGRWTFDSVRKAIQARGRPLTLSFRNDFLTTKQREILTKAVADIEAKIPPPRPTMQYRMNRPESVHSMQSHETDQFVNDIVTAQPYDDDDDDDMSVSVASSTRYTSFSRSFSASQSVASQNFRSFSEAGTSSVISSTLGPLMAQLMPKLSKHERKPSDVPHYLRQEAASLETTSYHHDFTASLL